MANQPTETFPQNPVNFKKPPVVSVVLGVEFAGPVMPEVSVLADFWAPIREQFPNAEKRPPLVPMAQDFDATPTRTIEFRLEQGPDRYWFRSQDESYTVQVQENRMAFNWNRTASNPDYPRYRAIREDFHKLYRTFTEIADDQLLAANPPIWCAITYTNEITHPESTDPLSGPLGDVLRFVNRPDSNVLPPVEDTAIRQRRLIRDDADEPKGRLYIEAVPTLTHEQVPGYRLTLRVVSKPASGDAEGVFACHDQGRDLIVKSFRDITTEKMHELWGLQEE
jgi:uncharacterized protein (TIGR04255 family)